MHRLPLSYLACLLAVACAPAAEPTARADAPVDGPSTERTSTDRAPSRDVPGPTPTARTACDDPFGRPDEVLEFHLALRRADWDALLASTITSSDSQPVDSPACQENFPKFEATFRCGDDEASRPVTVRKKKGEERGVEALEKPPIKIDFAPKSGATGWPEALGALGYRKVTLNNGQSNKYRDTTAVLPVLQAEHVGLRLLGEAVSLSPRTAYAKLTLHFDGDPVGEYRGVYILIEDIDRAALRRRGLSGTGRLEKSSTYNCSPEIEFDDGTPNAAKQAFDAFVASAPEASTSGWAERAEAGLALDEALRQEAAREILVNGSDTLFNSSNPPGWGNNWYAYDPPDGLRQYIPWDLDLAFGQQAGSCQPTPLQCAPTVPLLAYCSATDVPYGRTTSRLGQQLACHPELSRRYLEILCALTQGPLSAEHVLDVWHETYAALEPIVPLEADAIWDGVDPLADPPDAAIIETFGSEYRRIARWIPERIAFVQEAIRRRGIDCQAGPDSR
jgi:hypothetical protein